MSEFYLPNSRQNILPILEYYIELDSIDEDEEYIESTEQDKQMNPKNGMIDINENLNKIIYNQWLKGIGLGICIGISIGYFIGKLK